MKSFADDVVYLLIVLRPVGVDLGIRCTKSAHSDFPCFDSAKRSLTFILTVLIEFKEVL